MGEFRGAASVRARSLAGQKLLTKAEIHRVHGVSPATVTRLIYDGSLTPVRVGKIDRIAESEWLDYLAGRRSRSTASH